MNKKTLAYLQSLPDPLRPNWELDLLLRYTFAVSKNWQFLENKELATKIIIPWMSKPLLKRSTKLPKLNIKDFEEVTPELLKLRTQHLNDVKDKLSPAQIRLWEYIFPRKNVELFYATNGEKGKRIDRILFDIDTWTGKTSEEGRQVANSLCELITKDTKKLEKIIWTFKMFVSRTGNSFHVYLLLKKTHSAEIYNNFQYSQEKPLDNFTHEWVNQLQKEFWKSVVWGHEKKPNQINIDPSITPPGKLDRVAFWSAHCTTDWKQINWYSMPIELKELGDKQLISKLKSLTPLDLIKNKVSI